MQQRSGIDFASFIANELPQMLDQAFSPKELGTILYHYTRSEQVSDTCAEFWRRLDTAMKKEARHNSPVFNKLEIPYQIVRAVEETLESRRDELSPVDLGNLHELRDSAIQHMGKWHIAEELRAATQGTDLSTLAMRNITYATLKSPTPESLRALALIVEAVSAAPKMAFGVNVGGDSHKVIAGKGAWAAIDQHAQDGHGRNLFVENIIYTEFGGPLRRGYKPPTEQDLAVAIPPAGMSVEQAWNVQKNLQAQAQGGSPDLPNNPRQPAPAKAYAIA